MVESPQATDQFIGGSQSLLLGAWIRAHCLTTLVAPIELSCDGFCETMRF